MPDASARITQWLSAVVELLAEPRLDMPIADLQRELHATFDITAVSWNWRDSYTEFGLEIDPPGILEAEPEMWRLMNSGVLGEYHALMAWYAQTDDLAPQTMARVPTQILSRRKRERVEIPLARLESEHQMALNYRTYGLQHRAFVLGRHQRDFTDDDLLVAGFVQRSLISIDRQVQALSRMVAPTEATVAVDAGLTGRELAVLTLIAAGDSSRQAARRLGCSPRTVDKHLEHSYRKLNVVDRLNAVRVARQAGILPAAPVPSRPLASLTRLRLPSAVEDDADRQLAEGA